MDDYTPLMDIAEPERTRIRWMLRHANENGIVEQGVAVKFGKQWMINQKTLPEFLQRLTLKRLRKTA